MKIKIAPAITGLQGVVEVKLKRDVRTITRTQLLEEIVKKIRILKMKQIKMILLLLFGCFLIPISASACSVLYYVDSETGKIYVVNNEDYWYDVDAYIQIEPKTKKKLARLWYGWDNFAQGGINENGLFFDAAVTPEQEKIKGYGNPKNNLGDKILANCSTVEEGLVFLEKEKIALNKSHMLFGDKSGKAVIVEWVDGERKLHWIKDNKLIMTNYLLSEPEAGNYPCYRNESIEKRIAEMENSKEQINILKVETHLDKRLKFQEKMKKDVSEEQFTLPS